MNLLFTKINYNFRNVLTKEIRTSVQSSMSDYQTQNKTYIHSFNWEENQTKRTTQNKIVKCKKNVYIHKYRIDKESKVYHCRYVQKIQSFYPHDAIKLCKTEEKNLVKLLWSCEKYQNFQIKILTIKTGKTLNKRHKTKFYSNIKMSAEKKLC